MSQLQRVLHGFNDLFNVHQMYRDEAQYFAVRDLIDQVSGGASAATPSDNEGPSPSDDAALDSMGTAPKVSDNGGSTK